MKFKTKILQTGNNTGISVPEKIIESLGLAKNRLLSLHSISIRIEVRWLS
ncbi:MAG: hypothetical protein WDO16_24210 [Bacteroidota bacterium]